MAKEFKFFLFFFFTGETCGVKRSIRDLEAPTMGRVLWVRRINREIINNLPLRMKGDVINNKHTRYHNPRS